MAPPRIACVDVPALPLQLLLRGHPEWKGRPVVVVAEDRPQGLVLWVNEQARRARVLPGHRYAAALSLCRGLCAGEVPPHEVEAVVRALTARLQTLSPRVEPCAGEPGVFWLDASGLEPLYPSLGVWARAVRTALGGEGFAARVTVGFTRFGPYAVVRSGRAEVFATPQDERRATLSVPLDRLGLPPAARDTLARLGIRTVGGFLTLPVDGVARRFGQEAEGLRRLAAGEHTPPIAAEEAQEQVTEQVQIEHPETDATRLLFLVKRLLHPLLERTAARDEAVRELEIRLMVEGGAHGEGRGERVERVRPAAPTLDAAQILELAHLALEKLRLPGGATDMALRVHGAAATRRQLALFSEQPRRDLGAAARAIARLRTEFGVNAVVRARPREGHLPEAAFTWEAISEIALPSPRPAADRPLIRRMHERPVPLPNRSRQDPDGWLVLGLERGPVAVDRGPYVLSGGWWAREIHREYHFLETQRGDVLWAYYDRRRKRWFLQGGVE